MSRAADAILNEAERKVTGERDPDVKLALKDLILQMKQPGQSPFDAAVNVIMAHAETIKQQHEEIKSLKRRYEKAVRILAGEEEK